MIKIMQHRFLALLAMLMISLVSLASQPQGRKHHDGICSTTILYKGLKAAGADVTFAVPDRIVDGYGINEHLIDEAYE